MTRHSFLFPRAILIVLIVVFATVSCDKNETTSLNLIHHKIDANDLKARQNVIDSAGSMFVAERGRNPESLEELVASGYLDEAAIVDKNGNLLPFDPENLTINISGPSTMLLSKSCGACGNRVSNNSGVGDTCPHCGVRWGYETTKYAN